MTRYHYAPESGHIAKEVDGEFQFRPDLASQHSLMGEFIDLRRDGKIKHIERQTYGHMLFHGHRGVVNIYE